MLMATIQDLRRYPHEVLGMIAQGELVLISNGEKPVAKLMPVANSVPRVKKSHSAGFGMWKERKDMKDVPVYLRKTRLGRQP